MALSKGSSGRTLLDFEDTYKTSRAVADRRCILLDFNTNTIGREQNQQQAATITGNRGQSKPFLGNKNVTGSLSLPVDRDTIGYLWKMAVGVPTSVEDGVPDTLMIGSPTLGISSGTGTFSVAQTTAAVGDRVLYRNSAGTVLTAWLTAKTSDTVWNLRTENDDAGANAADTTAATVIGIAPNLAETVASPGTVTISSGVATFSEGQTGASVGDQFLYDGDGTLKRAYLSAKTSDTVWTVTNGQGFPAPDGSALDVESIEAKSFWLHTFLQHPTAELPSATIERRNQDVAQSFIYRGCKVNAVSLTLGGDGELLAEFQMLGAAGEGPVSAAYDSDGSTPTPVRPFVERYGQFEGLLYENEISSADTFMSIDLSFSNGLDDTIYPFGAQGERSDLPEGFAAPGGSVTALFRNTTLLAKAQNNTETSLRARFQQDSGAYYLEIEMPQVTFGPSDPGIENDKAVLMTLPFQAYQNENAYDSTIVVRMRNKRESY